MEKKCPGLLSLDNGLSKQSATGKTIEFYRSLTFTTPYSTDVCNLTEYDHIDFQLPPLLSTPKMKQNILIAENSITIFNTLFSAKEKLAIHANPQYELSFINCVFMSWIQFIQTPASLSFDNCILNQHFSCYDSMESLKLIESAVAYLPLKGTIHSIDIFKSHIGNLSLRNLINDSLGILSTTVNTLAINQLRSKNHLIYPNELLSSVPESLSFERRLKHAIRFKELRKEPGPSENHALSDNFENALETLRFLQTSTHYKFNPVAVSKIEYVIKLLVHHKSLSMIFFWPIGFFLKPLRIAITSTIAISLFAILYAIIDCLSSNSSPKSILEYIYFSFTIFFSRFPEDYDGILSLLMITEHLMGLLLIYCFTVSLVRKYLK